MKHALIVFLVIVVGAASYIVFFSIPTCVTAATKRNSLPTKIGICPPFVELTLGEVKTRFEENVAIGGSPADIKSALGDLATAYSWDRFNEGYQAIIRHPNSNFHAITIYVYVDNQRRYERIEVNDSFTAL